MATIILGIHYYLLFSKQKMLSFHKIVQYIKSIAMQWALNIVSSKAKHLSFLLALSTQLTRLCQKTKQKNKPIIEDILKGLSVPNLGHSTW